MTAKTAVWFPQCLLRLSFTKHCLLHSVAASWAAVAGPSQRDAIDDADGSDESCHDNDGHDDDGYASAGSDLDDCYGTPLSEPDPASNRRSSNAASTLTSDQPPCARVADPLGTAATADQTAPAAAVDSAGVAQDRGRPESQLSTTSPLPEADPSPNATAPASSTPAANPAEQAEQVKAPHSHRTSERPAAGDSNAQLGRRLERGFRAP